MSNGLCDNDGMPCIMQNTSLSKCNTSQSQMKCFFYPNKYLIAKPPSTVYIENPFTNDYPPNSLGLHTFHLREVVLDIKLREYLVLYHLAYRCIFSHNSCFKTNLHYTIQHPWTMLNYWSFFFPNVIHWLSRFLFLGINHK